MTLTIELKRRENVVNNADATIVLEFIRAIYKLEHMSIKL
jgi:hypothetical protein